MGLIVRTAAEVATAALEAHKMACADAVDGVVEARARAMGYNSAAHLSGYATSTRADWAAEAHAFIAWRDACWTIALNMLAIALAGGSIPTVAQVVGALPPWPG